MTKVHLVAKPTPIDILLGKTKESFNHEGNKRFRDIISQSLDTYGTLNNRGDKSKVVQNLIDSIIDSGSRFLKYDKEIRSWYVIPKADKTIKEKVGHALRDTLAYKPKHGKRRHSINKNRKNKSKAVVKNKCLEEKTNGSNLLSRSTPSKARSASTVSLTELLQQSKDVEQPNSPPLSTVIVSKTTSSSSSSSSSMNRSRPLDKTHDISGKPIVALPTPKVHVIPDNPVSSAAAKIINRNNTSSSSSSSSSSSVAPVPAKSKHLQLSTTCPPPPPPSLEQLNASIQNAHELNDATMSLLELITVKEDSSSSSNNLDVPPLLDFDDHNEKCHYEMKIDFHLDMVAENHEPELFVHDDRMSDAFMVDVGEMPKLSAQQQMQIQQQKQHQQHKKMALTSDWVDYLDVLAV